MVYNLVDRAFLLSNKQFHVDKRRIITQVLLNRNDYLRIKYHDYALTLTDTMLGKRYVLPKIHKEGFPVRPIISLINSPTYKLAKFLYQDLKETFPLPASHVNNSFEIVSKVFLISLDATSFFTKITYEQVLKSLAFRKRASLIHRKCKTPFHEIITCTNFYSTILLLAMNIINK